MSEKEKTSVLDKAPAEVKEAFAAWVAAQIEGSRTVRTHRCPACGEVIQGYAYPIDDLECRIQEHLQRKHGFMGEG